MNARVVPDWARSGPSSATEPATCRSSVGALIIASTPSSGAPAVSAKRNQETLDARNATRYASCEWEAEMTAGMARQDSETYLPTTDEADQVASVHDFLAAHEHAGRGPLSPRYFLAGAGVGDQ